MKKKEEKVYKNKKANSLACPHTHIICIFDVGVTVLLDLLACQPTGL